MNELLEKCLNITGSFEGASWGGSVGNFDGAGFSVWILQFNPRSGSVQPIVRAMAQTNPDLFRKSIKDDAEAKSLITACNSSDWNVMQDFVSRITTGEQFDEKDETHFSGGKHLVSFWIQAFFNLGNNFKPQQMQAAQKYFNDAIEECKKFNLNTERSVVFMFDQCVQRGKGSLSDEQREFLRIEKTPDYKEDDDLWLKYILDHDSAEVPEVFRQDVRSRRACILNDGGIVHGREYDLGKEFGLTDNKVL